VAGVAGKSPTFQMQFFIFFIFFEKVGDFPATPATFYKHPISITNPKIPH
jgi:hypothetical protein